MSVDLKFEKSEPICTKFTGSAALANEIILIINTFLARSVLLGYLPCIKYFSLPIPF